MYFFKKSIVITAACCLLMLSFSCSSSEQATQANDGNVVGIRLESKLAFDPDAGITDVWGYIDPATGREIALVGYRFNGGGVYVVDVSNARAPRLITTITNVPGFDIKVWQNFMYTVTGGGGIGAIIDISDISNPVQVGTFPSSHNIFISDNGYLFLESPGIRIFDLNQNPTSPTLLWTGGKQGHDATVIDNRLYDFHGTGGTKIYDISNISSPQLLGIIDPANIFYHHSGWPTKDENYLLICDEGASHPMDDITMWDISDPGNPQLVDAYKDSSAIVHNAYIVDDVALVAYYNSGFKLFDVSEPGKLTLIDEHDTSILTGESFSGAFGVYPFMPSGNIYVSDMQEGLFIFTLEREASTSKRLVN